LVPFPVRRRGSRRLSQHLALAAQLVSLSPARPGPGIALGIWPLGWGGRAVLDWPQRRGLGVAQCFCPLWSRRRGLGRRILRLVPRYTVGASRRQRGRARVHLTRRRARLQTGAALLAHHGAQHQLVVALPHVL